MEKKKINILHLCYLMFSFIIPCIGLFYKCVIKSLINDNLTTMQKLGISGIFAIIVIAVIIIILYGKHFKRAILNIDNQLLECLDNEEKAKLIDKKRKLQARQDLFGNICFVVPVVILWLVCSCIEKGIVSLRGELFLLTICVCIGFVFNIVDNIKYIKK